MFLGIGMVDTNNSLAEATNYLDGIVNDSIAPASDIDVFMVDSARLQPPSKTQSSERLELDTTPSASGMQMLSIRLDVLNNWQGRVRFFDTDGNLVAEKDRSLGGGVHLDYPLVAENLGTYYVVISSNEKTDFDLITGTGVGGGRGGHTH